MSRKSGDNSDSGNICALCEFGTVIFTGDEVICRKHGLVKATSTCRRWRPDPLKRSIKPIPPLPPLELPE